MRKLITLSTILLCLPLVLAVYPGDPGFTGCVISNSDGVFNDVDCDKVPDVVDNCPFVGNPEQSDIDANGLGDMCDLVIDQVSIEPDEPMQGRSAVVYAGLFNNRPYPMRNIIVKVEVPTLGLTVSQPVPIINPGERIVEEILIRIPECAPARSTDFVVIAEYPVAPGQQEVFHASTSRPVMSSGMCPNDPGQELTVVDVIELQDIHHEEGGVYPFTITNNWPESKAYILTVQGHETWGVVEIQPGSVIVVPAGGAREGALHVFSREGEEGMKSFTLTAQARDDAKQVILQADLKQPPQEFNRNDQFIMGIVMFVIILILIVLVLVFMSEKKRESAGKEIGTHKAKKKAKKKSRKKVKRRKK